MGKTINGSAVNFMIKTPSYFCTALISAAMSVFSVSSWAQSFVNIDVFALNTTDALIAENQQELHQQQDQAITDPLSILTINVDNTAQAITQTEAIEQVVMSANEQLSMPTKSNRLVKFIVDKVTSLKPSLNTSNTNAAKALPTINVEVSGGSGALNDNVRAALSQIYVRDIVEFTSAKPRIRSMAKAAAEAIGFYQAQFVIAKTNSSSISVRIIANDPVVIASSEINITGAASTDPDFALLLEEYNKQVDKQLNQQAFDLLKQRINGLAKEKGYFDGQWLSRKIIIDTSSNTAQISMIYDSAERYKFGEITFFNQNKSLPPPLKDYRLRQLTPFKQGDYYQSNMLGEMTRQLSATRYFSNISTTAKAPDPMPDINTQDDDNQAIALTESFASRNIRLNKAIPVTVVLSDEKPNSAEIGLGFGTDTKYRIRGQYRRGLVNHFGHSFESTFQASSIGQLIDVRYEMPYKHPITDKLAFFGGIEQEKTSSNEITLVNRPITIGAERTIKALTTSWQQAYGIRYLVDQIKSETGLVVDKSLLPSPYNLNGVSVRQQALLAGVTLSKLQLDAGIDPAQGFKQFYQLEYGNKSVLSDADMLFARIGFSRLQSFGSSYRHQLVGRVDAGAIYTNDFSNVPYKLRYFAGGDLSVRGFDYRSLAPQENDYLIGGQYLATGSAEYNYLVLPKLRLAAFVDTGNSFSSSFAEPVRYGAGIGVRYLSPIGALRLDLATGIQPDTNKPGSIRLHFFIGSSL